MQKKIKFYKENGYVVINIFDDKQFIFIRDYFINKIYNLAKIKEELREELPLKYYHLWFNKEKIDHDFICHRTNRYEYAKPKIKNLIDKNKKINFFLKSINIKKRKLWDDGFGWIGFRLVRPNFNDGYPLSSKSMGFAKNVVSCWMPLINMQKNETLSFVPKSHTKTYKTYLPKNSKFEKTDLRLSPKYKFKTKSLKLTPGDVIFYHPCLLHSEKNKNSINSRINLEFRFNPSK